MTEYGEDQEALEKAVGEFREAEVIWSGPRNALKNPDLSEFNRKAYEKQVRENWRKMHKIAAQHGLVVGGEIGTLFWERVVEFDPGAYDVREGETLRAGDKGIVTKAEIGKYTPEGYERISKAKIAPCVEK
ncbi:MAG TPA: hypothetical protein VMY36_02030 [Patescibacteria group bacterium]|nr:hypothetical protein [Patescibacteria group bacterium]